MPSVEVFSYLSAEGSFALTSTPDVHDVTDEPGHGVRAGVPQRVAHHPLQLLTKQLQSEGFR